MTFREKLEKEHPNCIDANCGGGVLGCPCSNNYKYEKGFWCGNGIASNDKCTECWDREIPKTYEEGLQDAWELAHRINNMPLNEVCKMYRFPIQREEVFSAVDADEALAKLKAYEEEKEIKVGDVVKSQKFLDEYIVFNVECGSAISTDFTRVAHLTLEDWEKTGKHIDIENLLGQIRSE